jgi:hypothetical protein
MRRCRGGERVSRVFASIALGLIISWSAARLSGSAALDLPAKLTDQEFWRLIEELSEPERAFDGDNLVSNEGGMVRPDLVAQITPGRVFLGVGPDQNFTYLAAIRPPMAFVIDIRRANLHLHLMYKALFELSADRADFVSRLFTKKRPAGLTTASTATELMNAYWEVATEDDAAYAANLQGLQNHLTKVRALPLSQDDLVGIARVYRAFFWYGPRIIYGADTALTYWPPPSSGNYRDLTTQTDAKGQGVSYLGSEERFAFVRDLQRRNLIVPVVGDFAGPKALRAIGSYLKRHKSLVGAFYVSNVETYLWRDGKWPAFCASVAALPTDAASVFIRSSGPAVLEGGMGVVPIAVAVKACR